MKTTTPAIISLPKCGFADNEGRCIPDNKLCADPMRCDGYDRPSSTEDYVRLDK